MKRSVWRQVKSGMSHIETMQMSYTWLHLNQVNKDASIVVRCAPYRVAIEGIN